MAIGPCVGSKAEVIRTLCHRGLTGAQPLEKTPGPPSSPAPSGRHADALNGLETAVLADLNPLLNLDKMPRSPIRERLRETQTAIQEKHRHEAGRPQLHVTI
jgi:hypothetical protein